jgi:hypothetical protein
MNQIANIQKREYDASCIADYLHCPKLFYWRWVRGLVPKEEPPALFFGRVFHEALLVWYKSGDRALAIKEFDAIPTVGIGDDRRTREHGQVIFDEYISRWGKESWEVLYLEKEFMIEMPNGKKYGGRLDEVVKWNDQIYVVDHKTTSQLGSYFFKGFRPSVQMDGYAYACRKIWGQCSGIVINGISSAAKPKERFGRDVSVRTPDEIDRFEEQFEMWTNNIEQDYMNGRWPLYYTACNNYGQCMYWNLCVYGEGNVEEKFKCAK